MKTNALTTAGQTGTTSPTVRVLNLQNFILYSSIIDFRVKDCLWQLGVEDQSPSEDKKSKEIRTRIPRKKRLGQRWPIAF